MSSVYMIDLAARHNQYLAARQTTIAGNIANANTPGFKSLDLEPFDAALESSRLAMKVSDPKHIAPGGGVAAEAGAAAEEAASWETVHSGNSVNVEQELLRASETKGAFTLNTSLMRSFHRMLLSAAKG